MIWEGRFDGDDPIYHRIFQRVITENNYENILTKDFVLHGFAVDEGVRRNKGKVGAAQSPDFIRKDLSNFPVVNKDFSLKDFGDVYCENRDLEKAQSHLSDKVSKVLKMGAKSIVLGGGHELLYAHFKGIRDAFPNKKIGIINIDAHFDNRIPEEGVGVSSGTGFWQIAQEEKLYSLHIGIQRNSNTLKTFDTAHQYGMKYILADEIFFENLPSIYKRIDELCNEVDIIYLSICMDVFNIAIAPGVSAQAYNAIFADASFMFFFRHILKNPKMKAMDVAEVNPKFDIDDRTAKLAASLINEWFMVES